MPSSIPNASSPSASSALAGLSSAGSLVQAKRQPSLILASSSPYRRALLERLRYPFEIDAPAIDEAPRAGEDPATTAMRLATEKAAVVAARHRQAIVIGADQVAVCGGRQWGKPGDHARALAQLQAMRGRTVRFHTAVCMMAPAWSGAQCAEVVTDVTFRDLPDAALHAYLLAERPYDVAGSAKAEGLGIALLESIRSDDPTALIGLPLTTVSDLLRRAGIDLFATAAPPLTMGST